MSMGKIITKRLVKIFVSLLIVFVIIAVVFLTFKNMNAPAEGTIAQTPPSKQAIQDPYSNPTKYNGKYIRFTYPAHFKKIPSQLSGSYLEVDEFSGTDFSAKHLTIGVMPGSLSSDSAVTYRKQRPEIYKALPESRYGIGFTSSANGSEETAFTQHGNLVASVSETTPAQNVDLSSDVQGILTSMQWK
jgi:hypothetical protein